MRQLPEEVLFDKRLIQRHIREGLISQEEVDKRLDANPDLADQAEVVDFGEGSLSSGDAAPRE